MCQGWVRYMVLAIMVGLKICIGASVIFILPEEWVSVHLRFQLKCALYITIYRNGYTTVVTTVRGILRSLFIIGNLQKYLHFLWWLSSCACWWWHVMHVQCKHSRYNHRTLWLVSCIQGWFLLCLIVPNYGSEVYGADSICVEVNATRGDCLPMGGTPRCYQRQVVQQNETDELAFSINVRGK